MDFTRRPNRIIIGARTGTDSCPDTFQGYRHAHELGADCLIFHVSASREGIPIVLPKHALRQSADCSRRFPQRPPDASSFSLRELRSLGLANTGIPLLSDALHFVREQAWQAVVFLDDRRGLQGSGRLPALCVEAVRREDLETRVLLASDSEDLLRALHLHAPEIPTAFSAVQKRPDAPTDACRRTSASCYISIPPLLPGWDVACLDAAGIPVYVDAVRDIAEILKFSVTGASGFFTSRPETLLPLLGSRPPLT